MHPFVLEQKQGSAMTSISSTFKKKLLAVRHIEYVYFTVYTPPCKPSSQNAGNILTNIANKNQLTAKSQYRAVPSMLLFFILHQRHQALCEILCFYFWNSFGIQKFLNQRDLQNCLKVSNLRAHVSH